jgi:glycosyltransferase involved in cell wall biosynthesis
VDAVVHTATAPEPFGRIIVEGMLACRPVVASSAGGALEILKDGDTGLLVSPGDVTALRDTINRVRCDQVFARTLSDRGREWALRNFSVETMVQGVDRAIAGQAV